MPSLFDLKEREASHLPLLLFDCTLAGGQTCRWSTHPASAGGQEYSARVLRHEGFSFQQGLEEASGGSGQLTLALADADGQLAQLERTQGFRGARLTARFAFYDCGTGELSHEPVFVFEGYADAPDLADGRELHLHFSNRLQQQRSILPAMRVQSRCPWSFPATEQERQEALDGGAEGRYSRFYGCGYSAGLPGGRGNLDGGTPYSGCDYTKESCVARGMFREDSSSNPTARFAGFQYLPGTTQVRGFGDKESRLAAGLENKTLSGDCVPLIYGTAWVDAPAAFARSDGNLLRAEVLLGQGPIENVLRVVADGYELPRGEHGRDMTATGWYNIVSTGGRNGGFNLDFSGPGGEAEGDPHGGMAVLSVVIPAELLKPERLPKVQVLVQGLRLARFNLDGTEMSEVFTDNPAWVILDLLRRGGWKRGEIDLPSFGATAAYCGELIDVNDPDGRPRVVPRFATNLVVKRRKSVAELLRGVRNCAALYLRPGNGGKLELRAERTVEAQHPAKPAGSNAEETLHGGWPAYEFCDGTYGFGGILVREDGQPTLRFWSRRNAETPNRLSVEFQDAFSEYQQNSVSLADLDDIARMKQEVSGSLAAWGLPHAEQATRLARHFLRKSVEGNEFAEFQTSIRGLGIKPGDIITITDLKSGRDRAPFRVTRLKPATNFETVSIQAQRHSDAWYRLLDEGVDSEGGRAGEGLEPGLPRPLAGASLDADGNDEFQVTETPLSGGTGLVKLEAAFRPPASLRAANTSVPVLPHAVEATSGAGALAGGQTLYYALSALDAAGVETALSATVRVALSSAGDHYRARLQGLRFGAGAAGYRLYRGADPIRLRRVAEGTGAPDHLDDGGLAWSALPPPDPNYDHANFYWRFEVQPETQATVYGADTIGSTALALPEHGVRSKCVRITKGKGRGQEAVILENTATTLTVAAPWRVTPDATSYFAIVESSWQPAGATRSDQATFTVPARAGMTVQILGKAANAQGRECASGVSPLERWRLGEGTGIGDEDAPPAPVFAVSPLPAGGLLFGSIGFEELKNVRTVESGTIALHYWDEYQSPSNTHLAAALAAGGDTLALNAACGAAVAALIQIEEEIVRVQEVQNGGLALLVERGVAHTTPVAHADSTTIYPLTRRVETVAFPRDFFGSPASGAYGHTIPLSGARLAVVEFFVTNSFGNSPTTIENLIGLENYGLRLLSGGQISIQTEGEIAVQSSVAPPLLLDRDYVVRDVRASVREAPSGGAVVCRLLVDGAEYATFTIAGQALDSAVVDGFGKAPLAAMKRIGVEVLSVPVSAGTSSGRDLTVTIRL